MALRTGDSEAYFRQRERELRAQGFDPDDDEVWARPDNEASEPELGSEW